MCYVPRRFRNGKQPPTTDLFTPVPSAGRGHGIPSVSLPVGRTHGRRPSEIGIFTTTVRPHELVEQTHRREIQPVQPNRKRPRPLYDSGRQ